MGAFDKAFQLVLKRETDKYTDIPGDRGGPTKYGITLKTFTEYHKIKKTGKTPTSYDVKDMDNSTAQDVYKVIFWDPMKLDQVTNEKACMLLFDQSINRGQGVAVKTMQKALGLKEDGSVGPNTIKALNSASTNQLVKFFKERQRFYIALCESDKTQIKFLEGWLNRTYELLDTILS